MSSNHEAHRLEKVDAPWVMRTYAGHSDARRSNELYLKNLEKGQTGLSVAFDLPTQTGYDPDHTLALGEVGKVGVSIAHKGDMDTLMQGIPLDQMNTSMTINATAPWLLGLYVAVAEERGVNRDLLAGTTQNDIIKEYLSRGTYAFPPEASMRLTTDMVNFTVNEIPKWNPINICSYHLQEAGATPSQEIAYSLSNAIAVLDEVRNRGAIRDEDFPKVFGRVSFFVNAGIRFIEEQAKLRAMGQMWEDIGRERYGVKDEKFLRFRYGVQVNSLGLTEAQPENNISRIVLEALGVTLGRDVRARAIQLPAWNEALGLPRPWDQQWSLRIQQILAQETDLLNYPDIFEGSKVMEGLVDELRNEALSEMRLVEERGGAVEAVEYMKGQLVDSHRQRIAKIESGEISVVGNNIHTETELSPLTSNLEANILTPDAEIEQERIEALEEWKASRDQGIVEQALEDLLRDADNPEVNIMRSTVQAAKAGVTTGEWSEVLRKTFGDYRGPTGINAAVSKFDTDNSLDRARQRVNEVAGLLGSKSRLRILVAKPGLDGHSNGAEQIAVRARDVGMEVVYQGIRLTPEEIANSAIDEDVDVVGLSILSGSHRELVPKIVELLRGTELDIPVVVGGIIPEQDIAPLKSSGVEAVFTPKDFDLNNIMIEIANIIERRKKDTIS